MIRNEYSYSTGCSIVDEFEFTIYSSPATCSTDSWGFVDYNTGTATPKTSGNWRVVRKTPIRTASILHEEWSDCTSGNWKRVVYPTAATCQPYEWSFGYGYSVPKPSLKDRFSKIIQSRCAPNIITSKRKPLLISKDIREERARETLRRVIGEEKFINFLKHGFISVKAKSGLVYQIFTGGQFTSVFDHGKLVDRLCVVLTGDFPATDSLIMRYLLILNNEQQFRSLAIKHSISIDYQSRKSQSEIIKPLSEIFRELKKAS